jgi:predicted enzyme related to lactoylglutathione lyase
LGVTHAYAKLPAADVERARRFYRDAFALEPYKDVHGHLYFDVAGTPLLVFPSAGQASGTHDQFGFVVDDLAEAVQRVIAAGGRLEQFPQGPPGTSERDGIWWGEHMSVAWCSDTEGNLLSLGQFAGGSPFRRA